MLRSSNKRTEIYNELFGSIETDNSQKALKQIEDILLNLKHDESIMVLNYALSELYRSLLKQGGTTLKSELVLIMEKMHETNVSFALKGLSND